MRNAARIIPLLLLSLLFLAWTGTPTGTIVTVEYDEPSTNTDGSPLTNLGKTSLYWKLGTGAETKVDFPASSPQGGAHIIRQITVPVLPNQQQLLSAQVTATNTATPTPQESGRSNTATLDIDRKIAAVPGNLRVTAIAGPDFNITGPVQGSTVSGTITFQATPTSGTTLTNFVFTLLNSTGSTVVTNTEGATPFCFNGDNGANCTPYNTATIPNGLYTMQITMNYTGGPLIKTRAFTVSN